jgi:hypothetical protein
MKKSNRFSIAAIDFVYIERLWVETVPDPFQKLLVLRMVRVLERLQQALVSGHSAYVFGRTGARARKTNRIPHTCLWGKTVFDEELVLPPVPEIVLVGKARRLTLNDIAEPVFAPVDHFTQNHVALIRYPILLTPDEESVEVGVRPTHHDLQSVVEFGEGDVASHLELPPDGWMRAAESDLELVDLSSL